MPKPKRTTNKPAKTKSLLSPAAERTFIAKVAKGDSHAVRAALDAVVEKGPARQAFLWDLALRGTLPLHNLHLADRFNGAAPSVDAFVQAWSHIDAKAARSVTQQWAGAPTWLSSVAYNAIDKDPAP